ncbi:MAG: KEOPS complex subunit Pcc1 [Halodesulfurarchaeum sp.]
MHESTLVLGYDSPDRARVVHRSVRQEVGTIESNRTSTTVSRTDETITITIEADDLVSLRAGQNTWLGLVSVAEQIARIESPVG